MQPLIDHYKLNVEEVSVQAETGKRFLAKKQDVKSLCDAIHYLHPVKEAFSELYTLSTIVHTMGVTTASCKTVVLVSQETENLSTSQDGSNSMALLTIERDLSATACKP
jgi:hypothetical protein